GRPKGVALQHASLVSHMAWMERVTGLGPADVVLQFAAYDFDISAWEIFGTLGAGGTLVLDRSGEHRDLELVAELVEREHVTVLETVPSILRALLELPATRRCVSLRHVFCAGEAMPADLPGRFYEALGARLYNAYGPSEATIDATFTYVS